ncbi:MAG: DUF1385 domain-containing protein [Coriobacteriales bacterium]|jgi:uncharacterized protein YqhQ
MGESRRAFTADEDVKLRTHIGGQALIEGIMMRGRYNWAVAVREPDGNIYTEEHDLASGKEKNRWMYWPIVRGCRAFVESLALGYKALNISSEHAYDWDEDEDGDGNAAGKGASDVTPATAAMAGAPSTAMLSDEEGEVEPDDEKDAGLGPLMTISMVVGLVLGIVIFVVVPAALSNLILGEAQMNSVAWNVLDGVLRVAIFIAYIWLISLMKDIHRMFEYHGAEHKTIHCYEHGQALTPENAASFPRLHVRCGTAFMIMVMIIAIFVYTAFGPAINSLVDMTGIMEGPARFALIIATRIILLPVIAGVSYEITVRWAGQHPDNLLVRIVLWPGMQMQRLTTKTPDEGMLECAIAAMELVLAREELEEKKKRESLEQTETPGAVPAGA